MTPVERLRAAIDKLEQLCADSAEGTFEMADDRDQDLADTLHRTIDAQLAILRAGDWISVYAPESIPLAGQGLVALADAILGPLDTTEETA